MTWTIRALLMMPLLALVLTLWLALHYDIGLWPTLAVCVLSLIASCPIVRYASTEWQIEMAERYLRDE